MLCAAVELEVNDIAHMGPSAMDVGTGIIEDDRVGPSRFGGLARCYVHVHVGTYSKHSQQLAMLRMHKAS